MAMVLFVASIAFTSLGVYLAGEVVGTGWPQWMPAAVGSLYLLAGFSYVPRLPGLPVGRVLKEER